MRAAVGEKPVEDQAENREEEDDDAPEQLVRGGAVGLEDFHYRSWLALFFHKSSKSGWCGVKLVGSWGVRIGDLNGGQDGEGVTDKERGEERTEHHNVENQDNETKDSSTGTVFPGVIDCSGSHLVGHGDGDEEKVEEE
jgi:hypothetical protein